MKQLNPFYLGVLLVFLSAAGFGMIPVFALYAYQGGATVTTLLFFRFTLAALCFFAYIFIKERSISVNRSSIKYLLLMGGVIYTLQSNLYFSAVKFIPASLAVLIFYIYPIFVAIASSLVDKEILTKQILFSIAVSLAGLTLVLGTSFGEINIVGTLLALGAGLVYSCYIVLGNRVLKKSPALVTSAFICLFAALSNLTIGLATNTLRFDLTTEAWLAMAGVALVCTVLAIFTFFRGLELIGSTRASILSMVEPLVTIGFSALLFQERLTWLQILGGAAVLCGAMLVVSAREKSKDEKTYQAKAKGAGT